MDDPRAHKRSAFRAVLRWALWVLLGLPVAAIGLAAVIVFAGIGNVCGSGKDETTRASIGNIETALRMFRDRQGRFPTSQEALRPLVSNRMLDRKPYDAWGNDFGYTLEDPEHYRLTSYGADGLLGGEDDDADIVVRGPRPRN